MSRRTKFTLAAIVAGLVLIASAFVTWRTLTGRPSTSGMLAHLSKEVGGSRIIFTNMTRSLQSLPDGGVIVTYQAIGSTPEPIYTAVDAGEYLAGTLALDIASLRDARTALTSGTIGKRLRDLVGAEPPGPDPLQAIILHEVAPKGAPAKYHGTLLARRGPAGWNYELTGGAFNQAPPEGSTRSSFGSETYLESSTADQAALKKRVEQYQSYAGQVLAAREKLQEEIRRQREERRERFLATLKPGALFTGTVTDRSNQESHALSLEITELGATNRHIVALLRNDGGWSDARGFQGEWRTDAEGELFSVVLTTRSNQAIRSAGPILEITETWTLTFAVDADGKLSAQNQRYAYVFNPVPAAEIAAVKDDLARNHHVALAATGAGRVYLGAAVSKQTQASERVLLRFTKQQNQGALLSARLESPERTDWQRPLSGSLQTNRYRGGDRPVRLLMSGNGRVRRGVSDRSVFGASHDLILMLGIDGQTLVGEDDSFTYRLTEADADDMAQLQSELAERERSFFAVVRNGAAYDGTAKDRNGFSSRVRLRIKRVDTRDGTVSAILESREQNGIFHEVSGSHEVASGTLRFGSAGRGRFNPSGVLKVPFFSQDAAFKFVFTVRDDGLFGELEGWGDWSFEFPTSAKLATTGRSTTKNQDESGYPTFPTATGAYLLVQSKWVALPKNGGKPTYGLANMLTQLGGALEVLDEDSKAKGIETRPDKIATLTFSGSDPLPAVGPSGVVLAYIGAITPTPEEKLRKYPDLAELPPIQIAATRTASNGNREADLFRVAPGISAFHAQRVAALVEELKPGVTLHVCTAAISPGNYAVAVNAEAYEFRVK